MSNKLKIILAIITSILVVSGSAIIFNSQRRNSQISKTELSSSSSSTVSSISSSSSSQVSSVSISSSSSTNSVLSSEITKIDIPITSQVVNSQIPMVEKPKSIVPNSISVPVIKTECNLPQSPNLVKTDNGCFEMSYGIDSSSIFKGSGVGLSQDQQNKINQNLLYKTDSNLQILKLIATDIHNNIYNNPKLSKKITITFTDSKKTNKGFELSLGVQDFSQINDDNNPFKFVKGISANYLIYQDNTSNWTWKRITINEPKYLTDYLNCSTKFFEPLNGFYSEDGGVSYKYTCIPQKEIDSCSANGNKNPSIVFGFDFIAGRKLTTVDPYFQKTYNKDEIIQSGRFYCGQYNEGGGLSGVMIGGGYGYKCPDNQTKKQLDTFVLPKSVISKNGVNIECFSISKQLYSKNDQQILKDKFGI